MPFGVVNRFAISCTWPSSSSLSKSGIIGEFSSLISMSWIVAKYSLASNSSTLIFLKPSRASFFSSSVETFSLTDLLQQNFSILSQNSVRFSDRFRRICSWTPPAYGQVEALTWIRELVCPREFEFHVESLL